MALFEHSRHPHVEIRKTEGPATVAQARRQVHGSGRVGRFNERIAVVITRGVGSVWCAYAFALIALTAIRDALGGNLQGFISWLSSQFLQLVLLPIIIVGQNVLSVAADHRAQQTFDDVSATLHETEQIQAHLAAQDEALSRLMEQLG